MERENEASEEEFGGQTDGTEEEEESRTQAQSTAIYQRVEYWALVAGRVQEE